MNKLILLMAVILLEIPMAAHADNEYLIQALNDFAHATPTPTPNYYQNQPIRVKTCYTNQVGMVECN